jgi:hypothetical protein
MLLKKTLHSNNRRQNSCIPPVTLIAIDENYGGNISKKYKRPMGHNPHMSSFTTAVLHIQRKNYDPILTQKGLQITELSTFQTDTFFY